MELVYYLVIALKKIGKYLIRSAKSCHNISKKVKRKLKKKTYLFSRYAVNIDIITHTDIISQYIFMKGMDERDSKYDIFSLINCFNN